MTTPSLAARLLLGRIIKLGTQASPIAKLGCNLIKVDIYRT